MLLGTKVFMRWVTQNRKKYFRLLHAQTIKQGNFKILRNVIFFKDILNQAWVQNSITGLKVKEVSLGQANCAFQNRQKYLSWRTSLLCIVVELAEGGSVIKGANPFILFQTTSFPSALNFFFVNTLCVFNVFFDFSFLQF